MKTPCSKNYITIAVSVPTTSRVAHKNCNAARQESSPQSETSYSSIRYKY